MEITIEELRKLRESEDHIEFKEAKRNYPDEQVQSDLDLLKDGKLNYAALILLGKSEAYGSTCHRTTLSWSSERTAQ